MVDVQLVPIESRENMQAFISIINPIIFLVMLFKFNIFETEPESAAAQWSKDCNTALFKAKSQYFRTKNKN